MSKAVTYLFTFILIFVLLPVGIYKFYCSYQDGLYPSLSEYASFPDKEGAKPYDGKYEVKVMKYNGTGGEEKYVFKVYLINHEDDTTTFIKTVKISSYGTGIEPVVPNDQAPGQYEITLMFTSSGGNETLVIDAVNGMVKGKKLRGGFF